MFLGNDAVGTQQYWRCIYTHMQTSKQSYLRAHAYYQDTFSSSKSESRKSYLLTPEQMDPSCWKLQLSFLTENLHWASWEYMYKFGYIFSHFTIFQIFLFHLYTASHYCQSKILVGIFTRVCLWWVPRILPGWGIWLLSFLATCRIWVSWSRRWIWTWPLWAAFYK